MSLERAVVSVGWSLRLSSGWWVSRYGFRVASGPVKCSCLAALVIDGLGALIFACAYFVPVLLYMLKYICV